MSSYQFRKTKSRLSRTYINGLRKISLSCDGHSECTCFLWIDPQEQVQHIQFIFNENALEWFEGQGVTINETNRKSQPVETIGVHKGVRTLQRVQDVSILEEGQVIIGQAVFPEPYGRWMREKFLV